MTESAWRNRITDSDTVPAASLTAHPLNYRDHPESQREAVDNMLGEVGWIKEVIVNQRTGRIIDGHLRVERAQASGGDVPVLYVDLSENEEALILATLDPLADMAGKDTEKLSGILDEFDRDSEVIDSLYQQISSANGIDTEDRRDSEHEGEGDGSGSDGPKVVRCPRCGHKWAPDDPGE